MKGTNKVDSVYVKTKDFNLESITLDLPKPTNSPDIFDCPLRYDNKRLYLVLPITQDVRVFQTYKYQAEKTPENVDGYKIAVNITDEINDILFNDIPQLTIDELKKFLSNPEFQANPACSLARTTVCRKDPIDNIRLPINKENDTAYFKFKSYFDKETSTQKLNTLITCPSNGQARKRISIDEILGKTLKCQIVIEVLDFSLCSSMSGDKTGFMRYNVKHLDVLEMTDDLNFSYLEGLELD